MFEKVNASRHQSYIDYSAKVILGTFDYKRNIEIQSMRKCQEFSIMVGYVKSCKDLLLSKLKRNSQNCCLSSRLTVCYKESTANM